MPGIKGSGTQLAPPRPGYSLGHLPIRGGGAEQPASSSKDKHVLDLQVRVEIDRHLVGEQRIDEREDLHPSRGIGPLLSALILCHQCIAGKGQLVKDAHIVAFVLLGKKRFKPQTTQTKSHHCT